MKKLHIDFAPSGVRKALFHLHPLVLVGMVLGIALCIGAAAAGYQLMELARTQAAQVRHHQQRQAMLAKANLVVEKKLIPEAQARAINSVISQLNVPWRDLQEAIALATPATVALLTLEPDIKKRLIKITAETKTSDAMFAYIQALQQQAFFSGVTLTRHEINEQDANNPIRFQIEAEWVS